VATMEYKFKECIEIVGNPSEVTSPHRLFWLRIMFGRSRSRWFGSLADLTVPVALRAPMFKTFAWKYGADIDEVRYPLDSYCTFNDFFCRALQEGARPIASVPRGMVSPVDGVLLTEGIIDGPNARVEQVKGATYSVSAFLGLDPMQNTAEKTVVRYAVLYLAPGNYHRFHSPCEMTLEKGRHFAGEVLPLRTRLLEHFDDIFTVNERVCLSGRWQFGQMHYVAVAAYNVGNIFLDFDVKLVTNKMRDITVHCGGDISSKLFGKGVDFGPGEMIGGFKLGSTVVLVFDAPENFEWKVGVGESVRVGQPLGEVS